MSEPKNFNHVDMDRWLTENKITEIECLVPDLTGVARGKILPREKFSTERAMRLPEAVLGVTVTGESPSGHDGYDSVFGFTDKDMVLLPDPTTLRLVPWAQDPNRASDHGLCESQRRCQSTLHHAMCCAVCWIYTKTLAGRPLWHQS